MGKVLVVLLSFMFVSQSQAQDVVEPKLLIINPGGGGYNLEQRVNELERSNNFLNQAVRDAHFRTSALERRLVDLERRVNGGYGGNNGGGYGADRVRCEMYIGASRLVETGRDNYDAESKLRQGCRRELGSRECDFARVSCQVIR